MTVALTIPQVYNYALNASSPGVGFPVLEALAIVAIAMRESSLIPTAHNFNPPIDDSWGLTQLNLIDEGIKNKLASEGITSVNLIDPQVNLRGAYILWNHYDKNMGVLWAINKGGLYQSRYEANLIVVHRTLLGI